MKVTNSLNYFDPQKHFKLCDIIILILLVENVIFLKAFMITPYLHRFISPIKKQRS